MLKGIGIILGVLAIAASLIVAGCGGSSSESLTKAEYVRKGNAICGKWQQGRTELFEEFAAEFEKNGTEPTDADKEKALVKLMQPYEEATSKLAELDPPDGEEAKVNAMVAAMEKAASQVKANPQSVISSSVPFIKPNKLAEAYGLKECRV